MKNWIWWQKFSPYNWTDESGHVSAVHKVDKPKRQIFQGREKLKREEFVSELNKPEKIGFKSTIHL